MTAFTRRHRKVDGLALLSMAWGALALASCAPAPTMESGAASVAATAPAAYTAEPAWRSLFDGESLGAWEAVDFGGQGTVHVEEGVIVLPMGETLTGIRWSRPFPTVDYEIELEAQRVEGIDFFCGLTFPVGESCASLIVGGWAGDTVGISSLEGMDASENETTRYRSFEMYKWYPVRLRVTKKKLEAWLAGEKIVDVETQGRDIGTRPEIDLCRPLGLASYQTTAALRNIRWRPVKTRQGP